MQIIKIDRNSVKRNPNAFCTETRVPLCSECRFETNMELPEWLKAASLWHEMEFDTGMIKYHLHDISLQDKLAEFGMEAKKQGKDFKMLVDHKFQVISHFPEPEYLFKYEDTKVECENCNHKMYVNEIEDITDYDDSGSEIVICPVCKGFNTFEYDYENINNVVKEMKNL